jgi:hypothetical protein
MLWSRKSAPVHEKPRAIGVDVTASRARAVAVAGGKVRPVVLDDPAEDLAFVVAGDRKPPAVGRAGVGLVRRLPHAAWSNFLPFLGQPREWRSGRIALTPEAALELCFTKVRVPVVAECEAVGLTLPYYLTPAQVAKAVAVAGRARLPLKGTAAAPLAVVADRAVAVLEGRAAGDPPSDDWVVPLRPAAGGPGAVVVIDVDEFALSAAVVVLERDAAKMAGSACWPRLGAKAWADRLIDAVSDRCVRLCRRDPRDSADAEQALFEQLDAALDKARAGQRVNLTVRTDHWFQDVALLPEEFDAYCSTPARSAAEGVRELAAEHPAPPRAVWLTHAAGRLPGLVRAVNEHTFGSTTVDVLPPDAAARAAVALVPRWLAGDLPRQHLDSVIPIPPVSRDAESAERSAPSAPRSAPQTPRRG